MKRTGLFCFLSALLLLIIFHQSILTSLTQWSIRTYSVSKWGKPLEYEKVDFNGRRLTILSPKLGDLFSAQSTILNFSFDWRNRRLFIDIAIDQPHWHYQTAAVRTHIRNWDKLLHQEQKWIKTQPAFHVKNGSITWISEDASLNHQLHFDLDANNQEGGIVKIYFNSDDFASDCLEFQLHSSPEGMEADCSCSNVSCSSLFALYQFFGMGLSPWSITSGTLQGQLKAIFPDTHRPYLEGELFVDRLDFNQKTELKGHIEQARLTLKKNEIAAEIKDQAPPFIGQLDILHSASLAYVSPLQEWTIDQIEGSIRLNDIETAIFDLKALCGDSQNRSQWSLQGEANLNAKRSLNFDLNLLCASSENPTGAIHLSFHESREGSKKAEIQLQTFSHRECDFLQKLLGSYWPIFTEIKLYQGELNALIEADVTEKGIGILHVKEFQALHIKSKLKPWNVKCHFDQIKGQGKVNLGSENFWQTLHAGLHLEDGEVHFEEFSSHLPIYDIQAHLLIQQGRIEHSLVTLQLAGLKGVMDIEWGDLNQLLIFKLDGTVQDLAEFLPNFLQEGIRKKFNDNRIMILANIKRQNQQVELGGTLHIQRKDAEQMDLIHFGCELKKISHEPVAKFVPTGWFYGHNFPLDKFLSPFIFRNGNLEMSGVMEFQGSFNDQFITINYDTENLKLENEDLCIDIKQMPSVISGELIGFHQINLTDYSHQGTLPIKQATYFEKNSGLIFNDIQGLVNFKNQLVRILPVEASCEGIFFSGNLELDYSDPAPGVFELNIHCPIFSGKISQVQHLVSYLGQPSLLHKIPLEGDVMARDKGLSLNFAFIPKDFQLQTDIQGIVTDGFLSLENFDMALKGIYMDVDYHHQEELLSFSDIQGTLLVGKPRRVEEYLFTGSHIQFHQILNPDVELDIAVNDHENEIVRIIGHTEDYQGFKSFHLDQDHSHISCIYPHIWQFRFKDWSSIENINFQSQFDLGKALQDLKGFRQTGLLFLSHCIIDKISQFLPIEGRGSCAMHYDPALGYSFQIEGNEIKRESAVEHYGLLKGKIQDKKWIIDQLQWDDLTAYAEIQHHIGKWKIPFLGLKVGNAVLIGLNGDFDPDVGMLQAKLNLCEVDLAELDRFESFKPFIIKWWPNGTLKASGDIQWACFSTDPWEGFKASLLANAQNLSFRDFSLAILEPFQIDLEERKSIRLQKVKVQLPSQNFPAQFDIALFEYKPIQDFISNLQIGFDVQSSQLGSIGESFVHHFPELFDPCMKDAVASCKSKGQFKGFLSAENKSPTQRTIKIMLEDGLYRFKKNDYDLKQFNLQINDDQLSFSAFTQQERCPFQIIGKMSWPCCQKGQCTLFDSFSGSTNASPLEIKWENHPQKGMMVQSLEGAFNGCFFSMSRNKEIPSRQDAAMFGRLSFDFKRLHTLLSPPIAEIIQKLKLGSIFSLNGHFWLNPELGNTLLETITFKGKLSSREAILKGYQVQNVDADLQYVPGRLEIQNLLIQDPAGSVKAGSLMAFLDRNYNKWMLFIPRLSVKNLKLSLLRDTECPTAQTNSKFRSLLIKRVDIQDFSGEIDNQESWLAQGNLHFVNPSRKNLFHPLLAMPAEIIMRLGLDPQVLNPVTGTIYFKWKGERFYLTRFKDVYSEGRGSKFYLAQNPSPSWMNINGDFSVKVRMKQYNLIFKIAELFTVSIQGNINKPRYSLQKQNKTSRKGAAHSL